jgi:hypothetical protein
LRAAGPRRSTGAASGDRRYRAVTVVTGVLGVLLTGTGLIALGPSVSEFHESGYARLLPTTIFGLVVGIPMLYFFARELALDRFAPRADRRTSPEAGLRAFLGSLRVGNYSYAWDCLVLGERPADTGCKKGVAGSLLPAHRAQDLRRYWKKFLLHAPIIGRSVEMSGISTHREEDEFALTSCFLGVVIKEARDISITESSDPWFKKLHITTTLGFGAKKLMRRFDRRWLVVSAGLRGPEDDAKGLEEAVRIARLSDSELAAEARAAGIKTDGL